MPIICLEGASAVGKSTTCRYLDAHYGFRIIPEVNELFSRPSKESPQWYFEKQVERWALAKEVSCGGEIAVLDGDPFQPLWYNWIYSDLGFQPVEEVFKFYSEALKGGRIKFPNQYFILTAPDELLKVRKESDSTRSRRNFELHLRLIKPQIEYFAHMNEAQSGIIEFINADKTESVAHFIKNRTAKCVTGLNHLNIFGAQRAFVERQ